MLILLVILFGVVLGMRFKVAVLVPAMGVSVFAVLAVGITSRDSLPTILLAGVLAFTCLQIGYLGGIMTSYMLTVARAKSSLRKTSLQAKSVR
jgi:hypothetical protein